jgi:hypothetical protein
MALRASAYVADSVPAYHARGKYAYRIMSTGVDQFYARRTNCAKYRLTPKTLGPFATHALALAAAESDIALVRPAGVAATVTTAGFTQPAVGATVVVAFTAVTGYVVGMSVDIATGGTYQITNIAALNVTCRNTGAAGNAAPTTAIATAKAVSAVAGPG